MRTIWKYTLNITDRQTVSMPVFAEILTVQMQGGSLCLWAIVESDRNLEQREFLIFGTGNPIPEQFCLHQHIGTVQVGGGVLVWHVFEA